MRVEIIHHLGDLEDKEKWLYEHEPPILVADLEAIVWLMLRILIAMLKRELKRLA
jgi:hypothetical protein